LNHRDLHDLKEKYINVKNMILIIFTTFLLFPSPINGENCDQSFTKEQCSNSAIQDAVEYIMSKTANPIVLSAMMEALADTSTHAAGYKSSAAVNWLCDSAFLKSGDKEMVSQSFSPGKSCQIVTNNIRGLVKVAKIKEINVQAKAKAKQGEMLQTNDMGVRYRKERERVTQRRNQENANLAYYQNKANRMRNQANQLEREINDLQRCRGTQGYCFKLILRGQSIPSGWTLATEQEASYYKQSAISAFAGHSTWAIASLSDGYNMRGSGYGYTIKKSNRGTHWKIISTYGLRRNKAALRNKLNEARAVYSHLSSVKRHLRSHQSRIDELNAKERSICTQITVQNAGLNLLGKQVTEFRIAQTDMAQIANEWTATNEKCEHIEWDPTLFEDLTDTVNLKVEAQAKKLSKLICNGVV